MESKHDVRPSEGKLAILDGRRNRRALTRLGLLVAAAVLAAVAVPLAALKAAGPETKPAAPATQPPKTDPATAPATGPADVSATRPTEETPETQVWEDYRRALDFLHKGGERAKAAEIFEAIAMRRTDPEGRQMADEARIVARRLRDMAREDREFHQPADPNKLTGQAKIDYLVYKLRDLAVSTTFTPGKVRVLGHWLGGRTDDAHRPAADLREMGKQAVPALIDLLDDTRLTRSSPDFLSGIHILEYRDAAIQILGAITGRRFDAGFEYLSTASDEKRNRAIADVRAWWAKNKDRPEYEWLTDTLMESGVGWMTDTIAMSRRLIELRGAKCADVFRIFVGQEPNTPWPLILLHEAGGKAMLEDARHATKSRNLRVRATAYGILKKEGEPGVVDMALADLASMKEMPETHGFGNALFEFLAGSGDDRAVLAVARLMVSPAKHVVVDAREATLRANPPDKITPPQLRLILPFVAATMYDPKIEPGYHCRTAEWIIRAAKLPIALPKDDDPESLTRAVQQVKLWWEAHSKEYPSIPAAESQPVSQPAPSSRSTRSGPSTSSGQAGSGQARLRAEYPAGIGAKRIGQGNREHRRATWRQGL